jgi:hypothetical protein
MEYFPVGFAAGIGAGIAIGISSGTQQARDKLRKYFESRGITLHDARDKPIVIEDTLDEALRCEHPKSRARLMTLLLLGCLVAATAGVIVYFAATRG